jgi:Patatin-like phospholipase
MRSISAVALVVLCAAACLLGGCATGGRLPPVPLSLAGSAAPLNISDARYDADRDIERMSALASQLYYRGKTSGLIPKDGSKSFTRSYLAISGGGDDGAFGAGLLAGWSARGDRPQFAIVTGVSTGALSAPFAFLGPEYDEQLKRIYTETSAGDIFVQRSLLSAVADDALADSAPLRARIASFVDNRMVQRIAEEYAKGRLLLILTTNLDQGRSVIWDIGAIATSNQPGARQLIVDVLLASAAIPGLFPPVMINVSVDGKQYQEMHVDGGATAQSFLYPPSFSLKAKLKELGIKNGRREAYIIRNGRLYRPEENVERQTLKIAQQAISTTIASSGVNDLYRMYLTTQRDSLRRGRLPPALQGSVRQGIHERALCARVRGGERRAGVAQDAARLSAIALA